MSGGTFKVRQDFMSLYRFLAVNEGGKYRGQRGISFDKRSIQLFAISQKFETSSDHTGPVSSILIVLRSPKGQLLGFTVEVAW